MTYTFLNLRNRGFRNVIEEFPGSKHPLHSEIVYEKTPINHTFFHFQAVVDRYGSQFRSSTQHDAQEFLFWLLDKVHEDLNTATKRRYKSVKVSTL